MALSRGLNSPIPGRLADQVPVSGGSPSEHTGGCRPNSALGVDNTSGKSELKPTQVFFVHGLRIPPRFSPCKTLSREMAQTSGFDPKTQVKTCLSLDNLLPWTEAIAAHLDWWQNPSNMMKGADLHPKDHSIQLFTDASHEGWGAHLDQNSTKGLWSDREKRLHIYVLELKAVSLALRDFKDQCQNQTVLVAMDNSTVVAYINNKEEHTQQRCALSCERSRPGAITTS